MSAELLARVRLSLWGEPGLPRLTDAVSLLGAERVLATLRDRGRPEALAPELLEQLEAIEPERELEEAAARGLRFVAPGAEEWPRRLGDLAHAPSLHERGGVPLGLWCRGPLRLDEATEQAVAVVGSRSATTYGTALADDLARTLARAGWCTVSGAAFGIDQAAHRGALRAGGPSIAVLACGADRVYPTAHHDLIEYLAKVGLVVSEAPPGATPTRIRFLSRNRLIAGLSSGIVVVEAAVRSGALNSASWAEGLGRVVMGVPGPVTSAPSQGVHQLIRARGALLVTRGEEVLEAVAPHGDHLLAEPRAPETVRDRLTPRQRQVLDAVPVARGESVASIARTAGLPRNRTQDDLRLLLDAGLVEHGHGCWRLLDPRDAQR